MIRAVIFDWFGVMTPTRGLDTSSKMSKIFNLPLENVRAFFIEQSEILKRGQMSEEDFWKAFNSTFPSALQADRSSIWLGPAESQADPAMVEQVRTLKQKNIQVAVLSNTFPMTANALRSSGNYDIFDKAFLSSELGACKPDADFFQKCIDFFSVKPEEILFIDDQEKNTEAAARMGLRTLLATDVPSLPGQIQKLVT